MKVKKKTSLFISVLPVLERANKNERSIATHENSKNRLKDFGTKIKQALVDFSKEKQSAFTENPVKLTVQFVYQQKDNRAKRLAAIAGGIINLLTDKVIDSLACTLIAEPSQICEIRTMKVFGDDQGVKITIEDM